MLLTLIIAMTIPSQLALAMSAPLTPPAPSGSVISPTPKPHPTQGFGVGGPIERARPAQPNADPPEPGAPGPGGVVGNIVQTIQNIWQVSTYLPEKTFRLAIEKAVRGIVQNTITETQESLAAVIDTTIFNGMMVVGAAQLPDAIRNIGDWMARAAVPLWAISLAVMGVAVMSRNAVGLGYGSNDAAQEMIRWTFIALASGNGFVIVNLAHSAFGALQGTLLGGAVSSGGSFVASLLPDFLLNPEVSIIFLLLALIVAFATVVVMIVAWVARFILLSCVAGLAPLAIASEGIPFTRFIFHDWLSMYVKLELVGVLNAFIFVMMAAMADLFHPGGGIFGALLGIIMMVGLASAIIGVNWSVFHQVFGTAVATFEQAKAAVSQIVGVLAFAGAAVATGGTSALTSVEGAGAALGSLGNALGSNVLRSAGAGARHGSTFGSASNGPDIPNASSASAPAGSPAQSGATARRATTLADRRRAFEARQEADRAERASDKQAREAGARLDRQAREDRDFARWTGALGEREADEVLGARERLAAGWGEKQAGTALSAAAPTLSAMARAYGSLTGAAKRAGYSTVGEFAGAIAEDMAESQIGARAQGRLFGASFAQRVSEQSPQTPREDWIQPFDFGMGIQIGSALHQPWAAAEYARAAFHARTEAEDVSGMLSRAQAIGAAYASPRAAEEAFRAALPAMSRSASTALPPMAESEDTGGEPWRSA